MNTISNDTTGYLTIYELEHIVAGESVTEKRRYVHLERIALYNSLETAEEAMHAYIVEQKERSGEDLYHKACLSYQIGERRVHFSPNIDIEVCTQWRSYTADGVLSQDRMSSINE